MLLRLPRYKCLLSQLPLHTPYSIFLRWELEIWGWGIFYTTPVITGKERLGSPDEVSFDFSGLWEDGSSPSVCRSPECYHPWLGLSVSLVTVWSNLLLTLHSLPGFVPCFPASLQAQQSQVYLLSTHSINSQLTHTGMGSPRGKKYF